MEITVPLSLDENESKQLASHSFLNALSIISSVCYLIEFDLNKEKALAKNVEMVHGIKSLLTNEELLLKKLENFELFKTQFFNELENALQQFDQSQISADVQEEKENLKSIFNVVETRANEFIQRLKTGIAWEVKSILEIEENFSQFFNAVEKNAKGKYKFTYNIADKKEGDYLIHFTVESDRGDEIFMPDIVCDIARDLVANARKFTPPGGVVDAGLSEHEEELRFSVSDTGMGIPEDEIEKVVQYGYRATNANKKKTYGGGFGLTKAYEYVKKNGGRFWIDSGIGKGTTIRFTIPKPKKVIK